MKLDRRKIAVLAAILAVGVAAALMAAITKEKGQQFSAEQLQFNYPADYSQQKIYEKEQDGGKQLLSLKRENPEGVIVATKAGSAKEAAAALKISQIEYLERNAELRFGATYKGYEKIAAERRQIDGYDSVIFTFSYLGPDSKTRIFMKYVMIIVSDTIYYITVQTTDQNQLDKDAKHLLDSIKINK